MSHHGTADGVGGAGAPAASHPRLPLWLGDVIAAVLVIAPVLVVLPGAEHGRGQVSASGPLATALVVALAAIVPLRRRRPLPVLAVCLVLFGAGVWARALSPGVGLALGVAMFSVAYRSSRRTTLVVGGSAIVLVLLMSLPTEIGDLFDARALQFALSLAVGAAAGDGARSRHAYIAAITERAERAERTREAEARRRVSEERLRIARDLHDTVAHQIAVISLNAGVASSTLDSSPDRARSALVTIRGAARTVLTEIGDLLSVLRADDPDEGPAAPQHGLEQLDALLDQFAASGLEVHRRIEGDPTTVTGAPGLVAYRLIQEGLTNAHKHGGEHRAHLLVETSPEALRIVVTNPVAGPGAGAALPDGARVAGTGVGLLGVRERVASVRGTVAAGPGPGGWKMVATIPLPTAVPPAAGSPANVPPTETPA